MTTSILSAAARLLVLPVLLTVAPAQWRALPANVTPPTGLTGTTLTAAQGGGLLLVGDPNNTSNWRWSGTHWSQVASVLPPRSFHAAAAHAGGHIVLFGGRDPLGAPLLDTWRAQGGTTTLYWAPLNPLHVPPVLTAMSMAYDAATDAMILVGQNALGNFETWRFDIDWSLVATAVLPSPMTAAALYSDPVRGVVGAFRRTGTELSIWELRDGQWTSRFTRPGATGPGVATFDAVRGRAIYFEHGPGQDSLFEFDGLALRHVAANGPTGAPGMAMACDPRRGETVLVTMGPQVETWGWSGTAAAAPLPFATPDGVPCVSNWFRLALASGDVPILGGVHRLTAFAYSGSVVFGVLGLSHSFDNGPLPRPIPGSACQQRVAVLATRLLPTSPPTMPVYVPVATELLGLRYDAQFVSVGPPGLDASNGLEVQIGLPPRENVLVETFTTDARRDATASGDPWGGGVVTPVAIGGSGRHGTFEPSHGAMAGPYVYTWDTDSAVIPASATLSGIAETVTDGRFYFTDFTLPAGTTVEFTGSVPAQIFVRGRVAIDGVLRVNGAAMTTFNARGATTTPAPYVVGQPGGAPGPGGGRGGRGGDECQGWGPIIIAGDVRTDGADGEAVQLTAGHAYAANAVGTGGRGSTLNPPTGIAAPNSPLVGFVYRAYFSVGGGGGGYWSQGGTASLTPVPNLQVGPAPAGGALFTAYPRPSGVRSLDHFLIGGSGGGGGGSHAFGTIFVSGDVYVAGAGGSGGGGACAIRAGGSLLVGAAGVLEAKGGAGVLINGRDAAASYNNTNWGIASPGGGGSGGTFLLQSAANIAIYGRIDTSGGDGSRVGNIQTAALNVTGQAGAGSPGGFRIESIGNAFVYGPTVPFNAYSYVGPLTDIDDITGSRSTWMTPASPELPRYLRYELIANVSGTTVLYSDDPAVSSVAADDPNGAVYLRFQGAQVDPVTGAVLPATAGPWRTHVIDGPGTLNSDRAQALRFDLVLDKSLGPIQVLEARVIWR